MALSPRLRGQEVQFQVTAGGVLSDAFNAVADFNDTLLFEKSTQGFLGESTDRKDFMFHGVDGNFSAQVQNANWMRFQTTLKGIAQRTTPDVKVNLIRTDFYSDGSTATRKYVDCKFGASPTAVPSRADFVKVTFDFSCADNEDDFDNVI